MTDTITEQDSRADGITAAAQWMEDGKLQPEHFTNPGADAWGDEGCNLVNAADRAWATSRHVMEVERHRQDWEARDRWGSCPEWEPIHWDYFLEGFQWEATRLADQRGWKWNVGANEILLCWMITPARAWALERNGIETLLDLQRATDAELLSIKGIGKKALAELREFQRDWSYQEEAVADG
ncbi:MAG: Bacterial polymerase, alpha chain terminal domain [Cyanobacteriota bacterium]|jgi:hypothetical protein